MCDKLLTLHWTKLDHLQLSNQFPEIKEGEPGVLETLWKWHYSQIQELKKSDRLLLFLTLSLGLYNKLILQHAQIYGTEENVEFLVRHLSFLLNSFRGHEEKKKMPKSQYVHQCHRLLVSLGDLARYKEQYSHRKSKNWNLAQKYYQTAIELDPNYGNPFNQLAVIRMHCGQPDATLAMYYKSMHCKYPFEGAKENIKVLANHLQKGKFNLAPRVTAILNHMFQYHSWLLFGDSNMEEYPKQLLGLLNDLVTCKESLIPKDFLFNVAFVHVMAYLHCQRYTQPLSQLLIDMTIQWLKWTRCIAPAVLEDWIQSLLILCRWANQYGGTQISQFAKNLLNNMPQGGQSPLKKRHYFIGLPLYQSFMHETVEGEKLIHLLTKELSISAEKLPMGLVESDEEEIIVFKGRNKGFTRMNAFPVPPYYLPNDPLTNFSMNLSDDVDTLSFLGLGNPLDQE